VEIKKPTDAASGAPDWVDLINSVCPSADDDILTGLTPVMSSEFARGRINTPLRQAHFLAQASEETDFFSTLVELGGPAYFKRYDYRRDLGNIYPGDGYKFRGRGVFQDTGRSNYKLQGRRRGLDMIKNPDLMADPAIAMANAVDYWVSHGLNQLADADDIVGITRRINGGTNGLSVRRQFLARYKHALKVPGFVRPEGLMALPVPASPDTIRSLQERLAARGYPVETTPNGEMTSQTVAAISAFQHDNDLPITGEADDATSEALFNSDDQRPIDDERAAGKPDDSRILGGARSLQVGSAVAGVGGVGAVASDALNQAEVAHGYFDRVQALLSPFSDAMTFLGAHLPVVAIFAAVGVAVVGGKIAADRLSDYRTMKTP